MDFKNILSESRQTHYTVYDQVWASPHACTRAHQIAMCAPVMVKL